MKIKYLYDYYGKAAGEIVDVDARLGYSLIERGVVEAVEEQVIPESVSPPKPKRK